MEYSVRGKRFEFAPVFSDNHPDTPHTEAVTAFIGFGGKRNPVGKLTFAYEIVFLLHYYDVALGFDGYVYYPALLFLYFLDRFQSVVYKISEKTVQVPRLDKVQFFAVNHTGQRYTVLFAVQTFFVNEHVEQTVARIFFQVVKGNAVAQFL